MAALKFNCAQRKLVLFSLQQLNEADISKGAHANTLEMFPILLVTTAITSLQRPFLAAVLSGTWALSRVFYTIGYSTGHHLNVRSLIINLKNFHKKELK